MTDYYLRESGGSDGNSGLSFALGWATWEYAVTQLAAGDTLHVATDGDGVYLIDDNLDLSSGGSCSSGSEQSRITVIGCDATGTIDRDDDATVATIKASSSFPGSTPLVTLQLVGWVFENITFNADAESGGTDATIAMYIPDVSYSCLFRNCEFLNASSHGVHNNYSGITYVKCRADGNGGIGFYLDRFASLISCVSCNNGSHGVQIDTTPYHQPTVHCVDILVYKNGGHGIFVNCGNVQIVNPTIFDNDSSGIYFESSSAVGSFVVTNPTISSNGSYGIEFETAANFGGLWLLGNVNIYGNSSGTTNATGGWSVLPAFGVDTSDPTFVDTGDGTEDFTPDTGSPLIDSGYGCPTA